MQLYSVIPNFIELRWELYVLDTDEGSDVMIGWHKRSYVCDHWAEVLAHITNPPAQVDHNAADRAEYMGRMERLKSVPKDRRSFVA